MRTPNKKTKIICTIGPASWDQSVLEQMIRNGMDVARINLAHGDFAGHRRTIANVRAAAATVGQRVALFGDLPGPKMRIGRLAEEPIELLPGESFTLQTEEILGDRRRVSMDFSELPGVVKPGDSIFMNDGYIQLAVQRVEGQAVHCVVQVGGELRSNKGVNFPGIDLGISAFTERDRELMAFAAEQQLDGVGVSFVQDAGDILAVRHAAAEMDYDAFVIAKIERAGALDNISDILEVSDAIMVARGDLGVEIPIADIPGVQKRLIDEANLAGKPVITATQMLESMTQYRRPTRSEATDVANAILDGTDCVMLSGETAVGNFPVETVATMADIAGAAEGDLDRWGVSELVELRHERGESIAEDDLLALSIYVMAKTVKPELLIVHTDSGMTARRISRFGLDQWIVAPSRHESTCQRLQFSRGIYPTLVAKDRTGAAPEERRQYAQSALEAFGVTQGLVLHLERASTLRESDTRRLEVIDLSIQ